MSNRRRKYTLNEVISVLKDDGDFERADIQIQPPAASELTDEDSASEDELGTGDNLSQLDQPASATVIRSDGLHIIDTASNTDTEQERSSDDKSSDTDEVPSRISTAEERNSDDQSSDADDYEVPSHIAATNSSSKRFQIRVALRDPAPCPKRPVSEKRRWQNKDIPERDGQRFKWRNPNVDTGRLPQTPDGIFNLFFDEEVIDMIVEQSTMYAISKGNQSFNTSRAEVRVFLAILLISGYSRVPRRRQYWSRDGDVRNEAIANAMTRDRFDTMVRYLHLCDNTTLDENDKFCKVRPLLAMLNERFLMYFLKERNLSINETMIPYYGRHGANSFIRGKPIRFGYKMWVLTTALGYVLQLEPYQGEKAHQAQDAHFLGMGGTVVMDLISKLPKDNAYHLTFGNLFTSLKLVDKLTEIGLSCTGTICTNNIEDCPVRNVKEC